MHFPLRNPRLIVLAVLGLSTFCAARAQTIVYDNFNSLSGLTINGDAAGLATTDGNVLRVSPSSGNQAGAFFVNTPVNVASFSTIFNFRLTTRGGNNDTTGANGADGITFILQTVGPTALGGAGQGMGYAGIGARSVAIEFDTFKNNDEGDPSSNHLGFDINGSVTSVDTESVSPDFDNGAKWTAWIDYNGSVLEVRASSTGIRPATAMLSYTVDLTSASLLNSTSAYVGFSGATGGSHANHDILAWGYSPSYVVGGLAAVPEPSTYALLALGGGLLIVRRWKRRG